MALNHVCGDHGKDHPDGGETLLVECQHAALTAEQLANDAKRLLKKDDPAHCARRRVIFSTKTMKRVDGVLRFRHTGALESYHSTSLGYTPKRVYFE